ncbi:hypothetical protein H5410_037688 [Solanum commersonii]|uniref:Uncharacterized protein n=1 Tax=Solanum commersonii TaxID=4109 RepID=A0A9J5YA80_SOLCO|nr:hypothetical protein H5410_037688 [Solanum commersonii]
MEYHSDSEYSVNVSLNHKQPDGDLSRSEIYRPATLSTHYWSHFRLNGQVRSSSTCGRSNQPTGCSQ